MFFQRLEVKDKQIAKVIYTPLFNKLLEAQRAYRVSSNWLPNPCGIIKELNIKKILESFQNVAYIGVLRQRWEEIKKLNTHPEIVLQTA